jgi:hypothetical protein
MSHATTTTSSSSSETTTGPDGNRRVTRLQTSQASSSSVSVRRRASGIPADDSEDSDNSDEEYLSDHPVASQASARGGRQRASSRHHRDVSEEEEDDEMELLGTSLAGAPTSTQRTKKLTKSECKELIEAENARRLESGKGDTWRITGNLPELRETLASIEKGEEPLPSGKPGRKKGKSETKARKGGIDPVEIEVQLASNIEIVLESASSRALRWSGAQRSGESSELPPPCE